MSGEVITGLVLVAIAVGRLLRRKVLHYEDRNSVHLTLALRRRGLNKKIEENT